MVLVGRTDIVKPIFVPPWLQGGAWSGKGRFVGGPFAAVCVYKYHLSREGPTSHDGHFDSVLGSCSAKVRHQLEFPEDYAGCQEEEEAGKEDGEKDKQVNVELVLTEEDVAKCWLDMFVLGSV